MPSVALKPRESLAGHDTPRSVSDRKAFRLIAQSRYQAPSIVFFAISDTAPTDQLSMIGNIGDL